MQSYISACLHNQQLQLENAKKNQKLQKPKKIKNQIQHTKKMYALSIYMQSIFALSKIQKLQKPKKINKSNSTHQKKMYALSIYMQSIFTLSILFYISYNTIVILSRVQQ